MKARLLWLSILIIVVSSIGNYVYYLDKQIDQPIFLDHYYVNEIYEGNEMTEFTIYYITNKQNPHTIHNVFIEGMDAQISNNNYSGWHFGSEQINYEDQFKHHYLMSTKISIWTDSLNLVKDESVSIKEMTFFLSNGESITTNIGEILITTAPIPIEKEVIRDQLYSSSSDHFTESFFQAEEDIVIHNVTIPFFDEIGEQFTMQYSTDQDITSELYDRHQRRDRFFTYDAWKELDVTPLNSASFPIELHTNETLWLLTQNKPKKAQSTSLTFTWEGITSEGDPFIFYTKVGDFPVVDQEYVNQLIKEHKEGASR